MMQRYTLLILILLTACSKEVTSPISVEESWIAEIPPGIQITAALMALNNLSDTDVYLIGASSKNAERIEIHRSFLVNELAQMRRQDEVLIPAKGSLRFDSKTGYHLMFYGAESLKRGDKVPIELHFRNGPDLSIQFEVLRRQDRE